jgi:serine/threonine protein kinase
VPGDAETPTRKAGPTPETGILPGGPVPGRPWGKYLIEKRLGSGGQAEVFQAFDQVGTAGHVALKVPRMPIPPQDVQNWVETEAGPLMRLEHPSIVRVVDAGVVGLVPYVAMQLVEGLPLNEYVQANPPSLRQVHAWVLQLAEALDVAHRNGIVHRDLKPLNVIITPEGRPLLIDFGLASFVTAYKQEPRRDQSGTYPFMAPEQARGDPDADNRVDVFALGGLLKYLLLREGPYHGAESALAAARAGQVHLIQDLRGSPLRRALCRIANRALSPDSRARYPTMKEMAEALRRTQSGRKVLLMSAVALGLLVAAGLVLGAVELLSGRHPPDGTVLSVAFQRKDETGASHPLTVEDLPLWAGDRIQIHVRLERPLVAYVLAIPATGGPTLLYPSEGMPLDPVPEVRIPSEPGKWLEPEAPGGTLTILLLARQGPLPQPVVPTERLLSMARAPLIAGAELLVLDSGPLKIETSRSWQAAEGRRELTDVGFLGPLAERGLRGWDVVRAVAFPLYSREAAQGERSPRMPFRRPPSEQPGSGREQPESPQGERK